MNYHITTEETIKRVDEIVDYLRGPRLWIPQTDYPNYDGWLNKIHDQLKHESKRALITVVNKLIVGVIVYQRHNSYPDTLEIKNLSISPTHQGRYLASCMLRNAELEGQRDFSTNSVHIDAKSNNIPIKQFLVKHKYTPLFATDLYGSKTNDVVFYKTIANLLSGEHI